MKNNQREITKDQTRKKIIRTATKILIKTNFTASTLIIAQKANIAHGTLFFHFYKRDRLIYEVVKFIVNHLTSDFFENYRKCNEINDLLSNHKTIMNRHFITISALLKGYPDFKKETKILVISLWTSINYYLIQVFQKISDFPLENTVLWQGALIYILFFSNFYKNQIFTDNLIEKVLSYLLNTNTGFVNSDNIPSPTKRICRSCSMLMTFPQDYPENDPQSTYCRYCLDKNGSIKSFDLVLKEMADFLGNTQGLNSKAAYSASTILLNLNHHWPGSID
ncbi:MAG: hypothetical protein APR63_08785 [Desulfuromonas sp. SDB]|nr:MAG: hypothetical protein APR63_08785 [Desulfuromonas sp. SDB]